MRKFRFSGTLTHLNAKTPSVFHSDKTFNCDHSVLHDLGFFYLLNKLHRKKKETFREVNSCLKLKFKIIFPILFFISSFFFLLCLDIA